MSPLFYFCGFWPLPHPPANPKCISGWNHFLILSQRLYSLSFMFCIQIKFMFNALKSEKPLPWWSPLKAFQCLTCCIQVDISKDQDYHWWILWSHDLLHLHNFHLISSPSLFHHLNQRWRSDLMETCFDLIRWKHALIWWKNDLIWLDVSSNILHWILKEGKEKPNSWRLMKLCF